MLHRNVTHEKIQSGEGVKHQTHFVAKAVGVEKEQRNTEIQLVYHKFITFSIGP